MYLHFIQVHKRIIENHLRCTSGILLVPQKEHFPLSDGDVQKRI